MYYKLSAHDTMEELHEDLNTDEILVPEAGHSKSLCSNKTIGECPVLGLDPGSELITDEMLIDFFVDIVADIYLANYVFNTNQQ